MLMFYDMLHTQRLNAYFLVASVFMEFINFDFMAPPFYLQCRIQTIQPNIAPHTHVSNSLIPYSNAIVCLKGMKIQCHQQAWNILLYFYNCNSLQCSRKLLNISEIVCRILKNFLYMPHFPLISRGYCFFPFATRKQFFQGYRQKN